MKFTSTILLTASAVMAQRPPYSEPDYECADSGYSCMYIYVASVGDPKSNGYKNALREDKDLVGGTDSTFCVPRDEIDKYFERTGRKDPDTSVVAYYELKGSDADDYYAKVARGSAQYLKAAFVALLAAYSTMV